MRSLLFFLLLFTCGEAYCSNRCVDNTICAVTLIHLISAPEKYDKKEVIVRGYFVYDEDQSHLFLDSEKSEHGLIEYSVHLILAGVDIKNVMERSRGYVLVHGVYDKNDTGRGIPTAGSVTVERLRLP